MVVSLPQNDVDAIVILNEVKDLKLRFFIPLRFIQNDEAKSVGHFEQSEESDFSNDKETLHFVQSDKKEMNTSLYKFLIRKNGVINVNK